ncbi:unnamed protein product, partial [Brassica rapa subsp. trilocularis]
IQIHTTLRDGCDILNAHLIQDRSPTNSSRLRSLAK